MNRIQQGLLQIKGASGSADLTLKLAKEVANYSIAADTDPALALGDHSNFSECSFCSLSNKDSTDNI